MILTSFSNIKLKEEIVDVPEIEEDGQIIIREMSGKRQSVFYKYIKNNEDLTGLHLIIACAVNEDGQQIASHDDADIIYDVLGTEVISKLIEACNRVNSANTKSPNAKKKS